MLSIAVKFCIDFSLSFPRMYKNFTLVVPVDSPCCYQLNEHLRTQVSNAPMSTSV